MKISILLPSLFVLSLGCSPTLNPGSERARFQSRDEAYQAWESSLEDAADEKEKISFLNKRFLTEGSEKNLLDEYEVALSNHGAALDKSLVQAQAIAAFGGSHRNDALSQTLLSYLEVVSRCRYAGERYNREGLLLQAANMRRKVSQICDTSPGALDEIAVCAPRRR